METQDPETVSFVNEVNQMLGISLKTAAEAKAQWQLNSVDPDGRQNNLSLEKMLFEMDKKHPRNKNREKFSTWAEPIGALGDSQKEKGMELVPQLGPGVTQYFRILRYLFWMYTIFTFMNIFTYAICGRTQYNSMKAIAEEMTAPTQSPLIALSFGHLGEYQTVCDYVTNPWCKSCEKNQTKAYVHCKYGTIEEFTEVGIVTNTSGGCKIDWESTDRICGGIDKFKEKYEYCLGNSTCIIEAKDIRGTLQPLHS